MVRGRPLVDGLMESSDAPSERFVSPEKASTDRSASLLAKLFDAKFFVEIVFEKAAHETRGATPGDADR
jgi:hypothetical protein